MKKIVFIVLLFVSFQAFSQGTPTGFTKLNAKYEWLAGYFSNRLSVPLDTAIITGKDTAFAWIAKKREVLYCWSDSLQRWAPCAGSGSASTVQVYNDTSVIICNAGVCDTVSVGSDNAYTYFLNDSTIVACDSLFQCDTLIVPHQRTYIFQNGLNSPSPWIVEFGGTLVHNTTLNTVYNKLNLYGSTIYDYPYQFSQLQNYQNSDAIASFQGAGSNPTAGVTYTNSVRLGVHFWSGAYSVAPDPVIAGPLGNGVGYALGTNLTLHGSFGFDQDDYKSKNVGIFFHTKDNSVRDAVTIYGADSSNTAGYYGGDLSSSKIAIFKTNKKVQFPGYGSGTNTGTAAYTLAVDASGNLIESATSGGTPTWQQTLTAGSALTTNNSVTGNYTLNLGTSGSKLSSFNAYSANTSVIYGNIQVLQGNAYAFVTAPQTQIEGTDSIQFTGGIPVVADTTLYKPLVKHQSSGKLAKTWWSTFGGGTPTWEQVLTAGSTLTNNHTSQIGTTTFSLHADDGSSLESYFSIDVNEVKLSRQVQAFGSSSYLFLGDSARLRTENTSGPESWITVGNNFLSLYSTTGDVRIHNLTSATTSDVVYYDASTGKITYGAAPSGASLTQYQIGVGDGSNALSGTSKLTYDGDIFLIDGAAVGTHDAQIILNPSNTYNNTIFFQMAGSLYGSIRTAPTAATYWNTGDMLITSFNKDIVFSTDGTSNTAFQIYNNRSVGIFNGTAPSSSVANGILLYSEDVSSSAELRVRDEAGNVTTLSPHNFSGIPQGKSEEMAWAYYSEKDGKYINVDMLKLARLVEKLTGEKLVYTGAK